VPCSVNQLPFILSRDKVFLDDRICYGKGRNEEQAIFQGNQTYLMGMWGRSYYIVHQLLP
jgi:hypothetical protein